MDSKQPAKSACLYVSNPLVITITIGDYNDDVIDAEIEQQDVETCQNTQLFVHYDLENICHFCNEYNYRHIPGSNKTSWTEAEIINFLRSSVSLRFDDKCSFDGLLIFISSHGDTENIITSDFKLIKKETIHRLFSTLHPKYRSFPRIIIFDTKGWSN